MPRRPKKAIRRAQQQLQKTESESRALKLALARTRTSNAQLRKEKEILENEKAVLQMRLADALKDVSSANRAAMLAEEQWGEMRAKWFELQEQNQRSA